MTCTWKGCGVEATVPQVGTDGHTWAFLCAAHNEELNASIDHGAKAMLRCWVLASGGAKKMAESM
jgi:hypothetical protein